MGHTRLRQAPRIKIVATVVWKQRLIVLPFSYTGITCAMFQYLKQKIQMAILKQPVYRDVVMICS